MKCNRCGYDVNMDDGYCPNCGTKVEHQQGTECRYCHCVMDEDSNFCPNCGKEVVKSSHSCRYCNYALQEEDLFCPNCGKEVKNTIDEQLKTEDNVYGLEESNGYNPISEVTSRYVSETPEEYGSNKIETTPLQTQTIEKKKDTDFWKNPIIWVVSISLLVICVFLSMYMKNNPSSSKRDIKTEELEDIKISKDTSNFVMQVNNNTAGRTYQYNDKLYLSVDGYVYEMNLDFSDAKEVIDESGEYIYVDKKYIYYCDVDYNYQKVDRKTKKKETLLENVYYPKMVDGMLYYQADNDGETIHVYNLETKEDRKINNEKSYSMIVDTKNSVIYYTNENGLLSKVNIDGTGTEVILGDAYARSFIYEEGSIYYTDEWEIKKIDLATKESTTIVEEEGIVYISFLEDKIVYSGYDVGVFTVDKKGSNKKTITTNYVTSMEVQGNVVIYIDVSKDTIYGATKEAKRNRIHEIEYLDDYDQDDSPDIDGVQEF